MTVKIGQPCKSIYRRPGGHRPGDRIVECELPFGHSGDHEESVDGATWPNWSGGSPPRNDDRKTTLKVPDSPKMLRETLCVAQAAVNNWESSQQRKGHVACLGRLIDECDRHRPLGADGKHGDRHTPTCGCDPDGPSGDGSVDLARIWTLPSTESPLQPVYAAVYQVIRDHPPRSTDDYGVAVENARVWRAVDAALGALGIKR